MASTLHAYSVRVHRRQHPDDDRHLDDLLHPLQPQARAAKNAPPARQDLLELVQALIHPGLQWPASPDTGDRHGTVQSLVTIEQQPRRLHGRLLVGQSGVRSEIRQQSQVVRREVGDVEERPLYFFMNLPKRSTRGLLLVERHGHLGVQQAFWNDVLLSTFRDQHPDLILKLEHFYPTDLITEYNELQGRINSAVVVTALHRSVTDDDLDTTGPEVHDVGHLHIGVKRRWRDLSHDWGRTLLGMDGPSAVSYVMPEGPEAELVEQMQANEVRVGIRLNDGSHRSVVLGQDYSPRAGYSLPDVELDQGGYPALNAMLTQALELEPMLMGALVGS